MNDAQQSYSEPFATGSPADATAHVLGEYVQFGPGMALTVDAQQDAAVTNGVVGAITAGHDMVVSKILTTTAVAGHDITLAQGRAAILVAGGSANFSEGGAGLATIGGSASFDQSGCAVVISPQVSAARSRFGIVLSSQVTLSEDSRVMFSTPQALAFGAALGAVFGLFTWLLRRR